MRKLFDLDSPLLGFLNKIFDFVALSLMWLLASLPIITIGASSAALYAAVYHCLKKNESYLWHTFWNAFRENWKRSTFVWLVVLAALAVLVLDAMFFRGMKAQGSAMGNLYYFLLVLICVLITWFAFLSAYCARCSGSVREVFKITFQLMTLHPIRAVQVFLPILAGLLIGTLIPGLVLLLPAPMCYLGCNPVEDILHRHMRPEDLEKL